MSKDKEALQRVMSFNAQHKKNTKVKIWLNGEKKHQVETRVRLATVKDNEPVLFVTSNMDPVHLDLVEII